MRRYGRKCVLTKELLDSISIYMNDGIREKVHSELAPCDPLTFLKRYLKLDSDFGNLLMTEFKIEM